MESDLPPDLETNSLCTALSLRRAGELVSIVGGGGKSALLFGLGNALSGRTILTTTTRIFANQTARAARSCRYGTLEFDEAMSSDCDGLLVIGEIEGEKARGVDIDVPGRLLAEPRVDFVVVEADGSRMLPTKAPAPHEPVIPDETTLLVVVAGIDGLDGPIEKTCHRPERVAALLGLELDAWLEPRTLAELLVHSEGGLKGLPARTRVAILINKIETPAEWRAGRALAAIVRRNPRIERVVLGALEPSRAADTRARGGFEVWLGLRRDDAN
jgi:molybdenum cofactor cytidylyltransferase